MSIPPVQTTPIDNNIALEPVANTPSQPIPQVADSIQTAPQTPKWSWSYMKIATVSIALIAACSIAAFFMQYIFRNADRAAEYSSQSEYYRQQLEKGA